jgi:hypothetical protein
MSLAIALIVSLCSNVSTADIQKRMAELQAKHPDAKISVRFSKKCGGK